MQPSSSWHWLRPSRERSFSWLCNRRQSQGGNSTHSDSETAVQKLFCTESETSAKGRLRTYSALPGFRNSSSQLNYVAPDSDNSLDSETERTAEHPTQDADGRGRYKDGSSGCQ